MFNIAALIFLAIAVALIAMIFLGRNENIQLWWQTYQDYLNTFEQRVENMGSQAYLLFTLMFLFAFKAFFSIYPMSILCTATGVVFPFYIALPVNMLGLALNYTLKYVFGKRMGAGGASIILKRNETVRLIMKQDGRGNPWLLFFFRLLPIFPVNPVSQLYGSMGFNYWKYLGLSLLGFSPFLISYTVVGRNVYNPFSVGFLLPLIAVSLFSAVACYLAGWFFYYTKKRRRINVRNKNIKKQAT